jgi:hypothetical protein
MSRQDDKAPSQGRQSLASVFRSVSASMFGVQSSSKHEEDFVKGDASTYIVVGLVATLLFVLAVWGVVQLVVRVAQAS